ncbi:MAG: DUF1192 domain-containing protein [Burkholderiaceae bacterium]|nr:DUF1192 domain-containing protein [Burkholderiaceae bacterium]
MARDDDEPAPKATGLHGDLTPLSVDELNRYIARLEAEIARAKAAIAGKQSHRSGADSLFKR